MHDSPSLLEGLPLELQQSILSAIADFGTLKAVVLSCPALFAAFKGTESAIIKDVLLNQVDINVLPEAVARLEASRLPPPLKIPTVMTFTNAYLTKRHSVPPAFSFADASVIARFHTSVNHFAVRFANNALAKSGTLKASPPSQTEIARFTRALYRFQIYNDLFALLNCPSNVAISLDFYAHHRPWENEQLVCILDFLIQDFAPGDMMSRNPLTPHIRPSNILNLYYDIIMTCPFTEHVLSFNLEQLAELGGAPTEEVQFQAVRASGVHPEQYCPMFLDFQFLRQTGSYVGRSEVSGSGVEVVPPAFYNDADAGPERVWRWSHHQTWDSAGHLEARKWGYVFWDESRLEEMGVFREVYRGG